MLQLATVLAGSIVTLSGGTDHFQVGGAARFARVSAGVSPPVAPPTYILGNPLRNLRPLPKAHHVCEGIPGVYMSLNDPSNPAGTNTSRPPKPRSLGGSRAKPQPGAPADGVVQLGCYKPKGSCPGGSGCPTLPQDPLAPRRGPFGPSPDRESSIGNEPALVPGPSAQLQDLHPLTGSPPQVWWRRRPWRWS
jgi:hypothetical protein